LEAYAWLDLSLRGIPDESIGVAPRTSPMHVLLWLRPEMSAPPPQEVQMLRGYVLWRDSLWSDTVTARFTEANERPGTLFRRLWGGPLWAFTSDSIDVVVELRDSTSGVAAWVRAPRMQLSRIH